MWTQRLMSIGWPAFLAACALEMLVFGLVDPQELHWSGHPLGWSRQTIYSLSFFVFWLIAAAACTMTAFMPAAPQDGDARRSSTSS